MPRYRTFYHLEEYLVSNLPYRTYSISLKKAQPRSEEGVHKEGEETVMIKLVDQEDLRVRKEREGKLALEEKKAGGQLHSNRLYIGLDENSVLTVMQRRLNLRICAAEPQQDHLYCLPPQVQLLLRSVQGPALNLQKTSQL